MSIKRIWIGIVVGIALLSVLINTSVLNVLIDRYFKSYLTENYETHVAQVSSYTSNVLTSDEVSYNQMAMELETHLVDPIVKIRVFNADGVELVTVDNSTAWENGRQMGHMMGMNRPTEEYVTQYTLTKGNQTIGYLHITTTGTVESSLIATRFKKSLWMNAVFSIILALSISLIIGIVANRRVTKALSETAKYASNLQQGIEKPLKTTHIKEVDVINDSLRNLNQRLMQKRVGRKALIDQMMHQSRTPLTIVKTHLEGLQDGVIEPTTDEFENLTLQIDNLTEVITNIAGLIETEQSPEMNRMETVEVVKLLYQVSSGFLPAVKQKNGDIKQTGINKLNVETDRFKLTQIFYNLIANAYQYSDAPCLIEIKVAKELNCCRITISDCGHGIAKAHLEHIFDAYYRGDEKASNGEGLGLYIVKQLLTEIGGTIEVISTLGEGTSFIIELPV
ncbi:MAG: hypothetical protein BGO41_03490 [Clostridiales bacterium 38-18]|nr:MAG: hypothetical protein BGO41_03490 [Clostridiales bacterium 38-18]